MNIDDKNQNARDCFTRAFRFAVESKLCPEASDYIKWFMFDYVEKTGTIATYDVIQEGHHTIDEYVHKLSIGKFDDLTFLLYDASGEVQRRVIMLNCFFYKHHCIFDYAVSDPVVHELSFRCQEFSIERYKTPMKIQKTE